MKTKFTNPVSTRASKAVWRMVDFATANHAAQHGNADSVRRAGRALAPVEIEWLIPQITLRGGSRDGQVQS